MSNPIILRDGRALGYAEYGAPRGRPVLMFVGTSSRLFHPFGDSLAEAMGARLICPERPGIGFSDFQSNRTLLHWPDDICELADSLGLERFAVIGASAGGPYAAACAIKIHERLTNIALVSSLAPFDAPGVMEGMTRAYRAIPAVAKYAPWLLTLSQQFLIRNPEGAWKQFYSRLPDCDKEALSRFGEAKYEQMFKRDLGELYRHGTRGVVYDTILLTRPWGFRPPDITHRVHLWQGESDVNVPLSMGKYLARTIPNCDAQFIPNAGHLLYLDQWPQILTALLAG